MQYIPRRCTICSTSFANTVGTSYTIWDHTAKMNFVHATATLCNFLCKQICQHARVAILPCFVHYYWWMDVNQTVSVQWVIVIDICGNGIGYHLDKKRLPVRCQSVTEIYHELLKLFNRTIHISCQNENVACELLTILSRVLFVNDDTCPSSRIKLCFSF